MRSRLAAGVLSTLTTASLGGFKEAIAVITGAASTRS